MRLLLPLVLLLAFITTAPSVSAADTEAPRIAVLRLYDVMTGFTRYTTGMEKIKADMAGGQAKINAMQDRMKQLETSMDSLKPDSDSFAKAELEFEQTKVALKLLIDHGNADIHSKQMAVIRDSYARLHATLADYCKEKGIQLVHLAPNPDIDAQNPAELTNELFMQDVLYYDASYDITDSFLTYLNAHVAAGTSTGVPAMLAAPDAPAPAATPATVAPTGP